MNIKFFIFNFEFDLVICVIMIDGNFWFFVFDVCCVIGIVNYCDVVCKFDDDEKGVGLIDIFGGEQELVIIFEFGFYIFIFCCCDVVMLGIIFYCFCKWVISEVLLQI